MLKSVCEDCFRILQNLGPASQFLFTWARNFRHMFFSQDTRITTLSKIFSDLLILLCIDQNTLHENQEPPLNIMPSSLITFSHIMWVSPTRLLAFSYTQTFIVTTVLIRFFPSKMSSCAFSIYRMTSYSEKSTNIQILMWSFLYSYSQINSFLC